MDSNKQPNYTLLTIGLDRQVLTWLREELSTVNIEALSTAQAFEEVLELEDVDNYINFVITGPFVQQIDGDELAQGIRLTFPQCRLLMIATSRVDLEINSLKKNGASEVYIYPGDKGLLDVELDKIVASLGKDPGLTRYRPVQLIDIAAGDELPFDMSVFLPLNNKYVKMVKAGSEVREKQFNKLTEKSVGQVYINSQEMDQFYNYCAEKLADAADPNSAIPETERMAQLQTTTRDLFTSIFDTTE